MIEFKLICASLLIGSVSTSALAQQKQDVFSDPQNLQILPPDISRDELDSQMRRFKLALGVECSYCHQGTDNRSYSDFDFASDVKDTKLIARQMLQMVASINAMVSGLNRGPDHKSVEVSCVTCHRGNSRPVMMKQVLVDTYAEHDNNIEAVIAKYIELRDEHYGGFAFDFGEFPVSALAFTLNQEGHPEDAIKLQEMNSKFHPDSANIPSGMGFIYRQAGQLEQAAAAFRKSLEINPEGRWVSRQLAEIEKLLAEVQTEGQ
jgi:tetratricopeptide (TPR) repeat protein